MIPTPSRLWIRGAVALLLAVGFAVRVVPAYDRVFLPGPAGEAEADAPRDVRLFGSDPYYHLRHARFAAEHFPHVQRHDTWTSYPGSYDAREAGLYALSMAGAALVLGLGDPSESLLRTVVAWTPAVLGVAALAVFFLLCRALWGSVAGLLGVAVLTAYPGSFLSRTLLGFSDHHAAEVVLFLLVALGLVRLLPAGAGPDPGPDGPPGAPGWGPAFLAALPLAAFHFTWVGAPTWLVTTALLLFLVSGGALVEGRAGATATAIFRYGAAFTLMTGIAGWAWPDLVQLPSVFDSILTVGGALTLAVPAWLLGGRWLVERRGWPAGAVAVVGLAVGIAVAVAVFRETDAGRWAWTTMTSRRTDIVREHVQSMTLGTWAADFSIPGFLAVGAPVVAVVRAWKEGRWGWLVAPGLALAALYLWGSTRDYDYLVAPSAALLATLVLVEAGRLLVRSPGRRLPVVAGGGAVLLLLAAPFVGLAGPGRPWPRAAVMDDVMIYHDGWAAATRWIRENTPDPRVEPRTGADAASDGPVSPRFSYGVIVAWDFGNFISTMAERPVLWSQGPSRATLAFLLAQDEAEAEALLGDGLPESMRYVVVDASTVGAHFRAKVVYGRRPDSLFLRSLGEVDVGGHRGRLMSFGPGFERSMAHRLYYGDGSELGHYRQRFRTDHLSLTGYLARPVEEGFSVGRVTRPIETGQQLDEARRYARDPAQPFDLGAAGVLYGSRLEPSVKVFERVPGARLVGRAPPGRRVRAATLLRSGPDREPVPYERTVRADGEGRYAIRVPYPAGSEGVGEGVTAPSPYRVFLLHEDGRPGGVAVADRVTVTEADVREGREVEVRRPVTRPAARPPRPRRGWRGGSAR